jgi:hypothetical protein
MKVIIKDSNNIPIHELHRDAIPNVGDTILLNVVNHYKVLERIFVWNDREEFDFVWLICEKYD